MKKILDFRNWSYSDVSGKYQNIEKPLKHQRGLGLGTHVSIKPAMIAFYQVSGLELYCIQSGFNHCLRRHDLLEIDLSAMAHHCRKMYFVLYAVSIYITQNTTLKSSKQRMAINNYNPSVETLSHL